MAQNCLSLDLLRAKELGAKVESPLSKGSPQNIEHAITCQHDKGIVILQVELLHLWLCRHKGLEELVTKGLKSFALFQLRVLFAPVARLATQEAFALTIIGRFVS